MGTEDGRRIETGKQLTVIKSLQNQTVYTYKGPSRFRHCVYGQHPALYFAYLAVVDVLSKNETLLQSFDAPHSTHCLKRRIVLDHLMRHCISYHILAQPILHPLFVYYFWRSQWICFRHWCSDFFGVLDVLLWRAMTTV